MNDIAVTFTVLATVVVLFVSGRLPVGAVALLAGLALYFTGVLEIDQVVAGFGDPTVLFIAALFVVGEGLDSAGVTTWLGQRLVARAGGSRPRVLVLMMLLVAVLTAMITVNGAVAALLPVVVVMAVRLRFAPSQLLMPLVFGAHAGSLLALTGTPVNVLVSDAAQDAGVGRFGFLEFALVGLPLVAGTVAIAVLFGGRLLPHRTPASMPPDLSALAHRLVDQYQDLQPGSGLYTREKGVAEVVIPPRSELIGTTAFPGMTTDSGDLVIVAIQRNGEDLGPAESALAAGDSLVLRGPWAALDEHHAGPEVLVVDAPELVRRQAVPLGLKAREAIGVLVAMVVLLASGVVPAVVAGVLAALAMVLLRVVRPEQAYRSINWTTVVLVGAMIPVSTAMVQTGAADVLAAGLVTVVGGAGPYALLAGLFLLTAALGQLISNMATALIMIPIATAAATDLGVSARPVLMVLAIACAASFLTPVATPVNMMVMEPGGYRFGDYWKLGLPNLALFLTVAVLLVPLFWPL
ncbi:SLC13 family permease [Pseudonocardia sp.]|uniref:SLC13 family permease n=1 Tax=Pseudonocardia sp. TaxID=60912 RepID=UPI00261416F5|nr:SLC13 family permease [Pseudonocardia sp.]